MLEGAHRSVATHRLGGRPVGTEASCVVDNTRSVALALSKGNERGGASAGAAQIQILRVDRMAPSTERDFVRGMVSRGGGAKDGSSARVLRVGKRRDGSGRDLGGMVVGMKHFNGPTSSTLMYATDDGSLRGLDLRMRDVCFDVRLQTRLGNVTSMCTSPSQDGTQTWAAVGTDRGYVAVWDLRFMTVGKVSLLFVFQTR